MKRKDLVVIFTDGYIFDIEEQQVKRALADISTKAVSCVFATTGQEHQIPKWTTVKIKIDPNNN